MTQGAMQARDLAETGMIRRRLMRLAYIGRLDVTTRGSM
jgi:hypothetical protein